MKTTIITSKTYTVEETATEPKVDLDAEWGYEIIASMFE